MDGQAPSLADEVSMPVVQSNPVASQSLVVPNGDGDLTATIQPGSEASSPTMSRSTSLANRSSGSRTRRDSLVALAGCPSLAFMESELSSLKEEPSTDSSQNPTSKRMVLELADGTAYEGIGFGAEGKSVSGECVFQTGWFHLLPQMNIFFLTRTFQCLLRHGWLP